MCGGFDVVIFILRETFIRHIHFGCLFSFIKWCGGEAKGKQSEREDKFI